MGPLGKRLLVMAATLAVAAAGAGAASAKVVISKLYYDSPGRDTGSNRSLNGEWIRLLNNGARARSLTGWRIRDLSGHRYTFGVFTLRPGRRVTIHTGSGTDTRRHRYWGSSVYIWNNHRDRATLKNANGVVIDRCAYTSTTVVC